MRPPPSLRERPSRVAGMVLRRFWNLRPAAFLISPPHATRQLPRLREDPQAQDRTGSGGIERGGGGAGTGGVGAFRRIAARLRPSLRVPRALRPRGRGSEGEGRIRAGEDTQASRALTQADPVKFGLPNRQHAGRGSGPSADGSAHRPYDALPGCVKPDFASDDVRFAFGTLAG